MWWTPTWLGRVRPKLAEDQPIFGTISVDSGHGWPMFANVAQDPPRSDSSKTSRRCLSPIVVVFKVAGFALEGSRRGVGTSVVMSRSLASLCGRCHRQTSSFCHRRLCGPAVGRKSTRKWLRMARSWTRSSATGSNVDEETDGASPELVREELGQTGSESPNLSSSPNFEPADSQT